MSQAKFDNCKLNREWIYSISFVLLVSNFLWAQDPFITTWKTDNPGSSNDLSITIPTMGTGYLYDIDWENDGTYDDFSITGDITHEYKGRGTYTVSIRGAFPRIYFNNSGDKQKIITIEQWGDIEWVSMERAFYGCSNLELNRTTAPDLTNVTSLSWMFRNASSLNTDLNNWNVSTITDMSWLFSGASAFNGSIENWNVINVIDMTSMFYGATSFKGKLDLWDVDNVEKMDAMFRDASMFNGVISDWKVDSVVTMSFMFRDATLFNSDISGWNPVSLTSTAKMFDNASAFNQDISQWDVSQVTNMTDMFFNAASFNQPLGAWNIENVSSMVGMLYNSGLNQSNYDQTLMGWASQNVMSGVTLGASGLEYCEATDARTFLDVNKAWSISGDSKNCYFITTWKTNNAGSSGNAQITIPTFNGLSYNYDVDWDNDGVFDQFNIAGDVTHSFPSAGVYTINIRGDFPRIYFNNTGDRQKIISVDQWGDIEWFNMTNAFYGCNQLMINAVDAPDLSQVTSLSGIFRDAILIDFSLEDWDISTITHMVQAFNNTSLSVENYDNTLLLWVGQSTQSNVTVGVQGLQYCLGEAARNQLISNGWSFVGDSKDCSGTDRPLILTVKTDNPGTTGNTQFRIQTWDLGLYNYDVDIGNDGTYEFQNQSLDLVVPFPSAGIHQIAIRGDFPRIYFNNEDDKDKIISIDQWGDQVWTSMAHAFHGCSNLEYNAIDAPDLSQVTDMSSMFSGASKFDGDLSSWDVSQINNMSSTFSGADVFNGDITNWNVGNVVQFASTFNGATLFNQNLGNWDLSSATTLFWMLNNCGMSITNYDQTLIGWAAQMVNSNVPFTAQNLQYCAGEDARNRLINIYNWYISGDGKACNNFLTVWKTDNPGSSSFTSITIPTFPSTSLTYNYDVDWENDGIFDDISVTGDISHDYGVAGIYTVAIRGQFPSIYFNDSGDHQKIIRIDQWGDIQWEIFSGAFEGTINMTYAAVDTPDLSSVNKAFDMFRGAILFDGDLSGWDVSNITDMGGMFRDATSFNGDLSTWNVLQVTNMSNMFRGATVFNRDISMWDVDNVINMSSMFHDDTAFNQNIGTWKVSKVNNMARMFKGASSFNQNLNTWDVELVTDMADMFQDATAFNADISSWKVNNVDNMNSMFSGAGSFNQDISSWIVNSVTNMNQMFWNASVFDQDLGSWPIINVTGMSKMLWNTNMSIQNYDNTLIGWSSQAVKNNVLLGGATKYCNGEMARDDLINNHNWTITGDNKDCTPQCGEIINTWIGPSNGYWHSNPIGNWSQGSFPTTCHIVVIPNGVTVIITDGIPAECYLIEVENGGSLDVVDGAILNVAASQ